MFGRKRFVSNFSALFPDGSLDVTPLTIRNLENQSTQTVYDLSRFLHAFYLYRLSDEYQGLLVLPPSSRFAVVFLHGSNQQFVCGLLKNLEAHGTCVIEGDKDLLLTEEESNLFHDLKRFIPMI